MNVFFKKNFVLILGISLPILLIIAFAIANALTKLVDPPKYNAVFALQNNYGIYQPFNFEVGEEGKLTIYFKAPEQTQNIVISNFFARIFIFDTEKNLTEQFEISPPDDFKDDFEPGKELPVEIPEKLSTLILLPTQIAPDGYVVEQNTRPGGNIFTMLFGFGSSNYPRYLLKKKGRVFPVPSEGQFYGQFTFIGWADKRGDQR